MLIKPAVNIIETIKKKINSHKFMIESRNSEPDFTRRRKLPFVSVVLFMLNLARQTLQKELTSFMNLFPNANDSPKRISKSAFSQSRLKLKPEAFIDLNDTLIHEFYTDNDYQMWRGFRLLSVDGTTLQLPYSEEIRNRFGYNNDPHGRKLPLARTSSCYDILNDLILSTKIDHYKADEFKLFLNHLDKLQSKDLLILDRWYGAIWLFFVILSKGADFVVRLQSNFIAELESFKDSNEMSRIIERTTCPEDSQAVLDKLGIKFKPFKFRLIKVELDNGEVELLATSLTYEQEYPTSIFKGLYFMRWGVEVNIGHLKNQVEIESFSGLTPISVEQDYYANMFIANLQSIMARDAKMELKKKDKDVKYEYKINKNLSLSYMKDRVIKILTSNDPKYFDELKELFKVELVPVRPGRKFERNPYMKKKKYFINKRRAV